MQQRASAPAGVGGASHYRRTDAATSSNQEGWVGLTV